MSRKRTLGIRLALVLGGAILLPACNALTAVDDLFLNDINNAWKEVGNSDHTFFFQPNQSGKVSESTFVGNEQLSPTSTESQLEGSFKNRNISFTVKRSAGNVDFTGTFSDENTIDLRSQGRSFTVRRQQ